jgi:hypothetical protein
VAALYVGRLEDPLGQISVLALPRESNPRPSRGTKLNEPYSGIGESVSGVLVERCGLEGFEVVANHEARVVRHSLCKRACVVEGGVGGVLKAAIVPRFL